MNTSQLRQVDLNLLVVFAVFAEERSVSAAATRLLLTQPAVSRALNRLRTMFNDDLFIRGKGRYELTPNAARILKELEVVLPRIDRLVRGSEFDPMKEEVVFNGSAQESVRQRDFRGFCMRSGIGYSSADARQRLDAGIGLAGVQGLPA